jgi:hypothetical protein
MAEAGPLVGREVNLLLRGAVDIWAGGLLRFYLLHIFLLPLLAIIFISVHYYKVAREHFISLPARFEEDPTVDPEEKRIAEERIDLLPNLMIHELMLTSVATFILVLACATFYHAPLEAHADPQVTPLHTEAPWYFLWLQGMLKLGDKTLFGVVLPSVIFGVIFAVPWIHQNRHRLASKRKAALAIGMIFTVMMVILTYMGTPGYGIETPPAQNILSHLAPATHPGPVRELPWDLIETGPDGAMKTYFVSYPEAWASDPQYADRSRFEFIEAATMEPEDEWREILHEFKIEVENAPKLIPPVHGDAALAKVTAEVRQPGLKWLVFTIHWQEIEVDEEGRATEVIPYQRVDIDARTGEPVRDEEGEVVLVTDEVVVFKDADGTRYVVSPDTNERVDVTDTVSWPALVVQGGRVVEEELQLSLRNAYPNLKTSEQTAIVAIHKDANYHR